MYISQCVNDVEIGIFASARMLVVSNTGHFDLKSLLLFNWWQACISHSVEVEVDDKAFLFTKIHYRISLSTLALFTCEYFGWNTSAVGIWLTVVLLSLQKMHKSHGSTTPDYLPNRSHANSAIEMILIDVTIVLCIIDTLHKQKTILTHHNSDEVTIRVITFPLLRLLPYRSVTIIKLELSNNNQIIEASTVTLLLSFLFLLRISV